MASSSVAALIAARRLSRVDRRIAAVMRQTHVELRAVKSIELQYARVGTGQTGIRQFVKKALPSVKFHNPDLPVKQSKSMEKPVEPVLRVSFGGTAEPVEIRTSSLRHEDILDALLRVDKEAAARLATDTTQRATQPNPGAAP
jgi:hypothetical protein